MTREKAKEICDMIETHGIEVIKAYGEGKIIQHLNLDGEWVDCDMPISFSNNHSFRIKSEEADHSCNCKGCKYINLESVDEPCCNCIESDEYIKENAELKERADKADLDSVTFFNQLCKAKEIIKDFLSLGIFGIFKGTTAEEIVDKAEDFLKENNNEQART